MRDLAAEYAIPPRNFMSLKTVPPTFSATLPSSAWNMPKLPEGRHEWVRDCIVEGLLGESGCGGEEANARRRCEIVKTGCGCDKVLRSLSWSASITDVLLLLNLNGGAQMDRRNCMKGVQ